MIKNTCVGNSMNRAAEPTPIFTCMANPGLLCLSALLENLTDDAIAQLFVTKFSTISLYSISRNFKVHSAFQ